MATRHSGICGRLYSKGPVNDMCGLERRHEGAHRGRYTTTRWEGPSADKPGQASAVETELTPPALEAHLPIPRPRDARDDAA